jgi:hypothetical protein
VRLIASQPRRLENLDTVDKQRILDEPEFQQTMLDHYAGKLCERRRREADPLGLTPV